MATHPTFPKGTESTGTAWKTRSGALVHLVKQTDGYRYETWFCTGCLREGRVAEAIKNGQAHADQCSAIQV